MLNIWWLNQSESNLWYDSIHDSKKEPFHSQLDLQFDDSDYNSIIGTLFWKNISYKVLKKFTT